MEITMETRMNINMQMKVGGNKSNNEINMMSSLKWE